MRLRFLCDLAPKRLEHLDDTIQTVRSASADLHAELLCKLAPHRPELWDEVIELANAITKPESGIHILSEVAQYRPELWPQILQTIRLMDPAEHTKSSLLRYVASRLPEDLLLEAIKIAMSIANPHMRLSAVCRLAHREPKFAAKTLKSLPLQALPTQQKIEVREWLTPVLPEEQLATAFKLYQSIDSTETYQRFSALCDLAQRQPDLWDDVLAMVRQQQADHSTHYNSMLRCLAVDLPDRLIPTLRDWVESIEEPVLKASAFSSLLPRLELAEIGLEEFERFMEILAGGDREIYLRSLPLLAPTILKLGGITALDSISIVLSQSST